MGRFHSRLSKTPDMRVGGKNVLGQLLHSLQTITLVDVANASCPASQEFSPVRLSPDNISRSQQGSVAFFLHFLLTCFLVSTTERTRNLPY